MLEPSNLYFNKHPSSQEFMIHGTNKRNIEERGQDGRGGGCGAHLLPQTHQKILHLHVGNLTESQPQTGRSSPIQPGLQDSHGIGKDRQKTAGGDLYSWEETKRKREIIGSKQAKPQTRHPNSRVHRIRILYTNIHYIHSHYIQK